MVYMIIRGFAIAIPLISLTVIIIYQLMFNTAYSPYQIIVGFVSALLTFCLLYGYSVIVEYCEKKIK